MFRRKSIEVKISERKSFDLSKLGGVVGVGFGISSAGHH